jgi:hypothetical protein
MNDSGRWSDLVNFDIGKENPTKETKITIEELRQIVIGSIGDNQCDVVDKIIREAVWSYVNKMVGNDW